MKNNFSKIIYLILFPIFLYGGCTEHKVDTAQEWCEQISGVDLESKYSKPWTFIFSVSFDEEAIRDDYTNMLNKLHLEKVDNRSPKMAWRDGTELHLVNLSSLMDIEPDEIIHQWKDGIEKAKIFQNSDPMEKCLYGTLFSLFDSLHIHSMQSDAFGKNWKDNVTIINTDRKEILGDG